MWRNGEKVSSSDVSKKKLTVGELSAITEPDRLRNLFYEDFEWPKSDKQRQKKVREVLRILESKKITELTEIPGTTAAQREEEYKKGIENSINNIRSKELGTFVEPSGISFWVNS